jgi:hypothetical protein
MPEHVFSRQNTRPAALSIGQAALISALPSSPDGDSLINQQPANALGQLARQYQPIDEEASHEPIVKIGSKRRKIWALPHKFHCPVIGVCFEVGHLRALMAKVLVFPRDTTDFVLHTTAVGACETRSQLAELMQKNLEKRYQLIVQRFSTAKNANELLTRWREASRTSNDLAGALWASWTHPACNAELEQEIYNDIHMIQHQVGTAGRASLSQLKELKADNLRLNTQLLDARREIEALRTEKSNEIRLLQQHLSAMRVAMAGKDASTANLNSQFDQLQQSMPDLKSRQELARRASEAEARAFALAADNQQLVLKNEHLEQLARHADETIKHLLVNDDHPAEPAKATDEAANAALAGKCILCVGGRSGSVDSYRQVVEQRGGRFLHHDGGLEESLHRIDSSLAAADLVVCQAGCISHNAYWRVKEQCKRTGTQCVFVKSAGISSFERMVNVACEEKALSLSD